MAPGDALDLLLAFGIGAPLLVPIVSGLLISALARW